MRCRGRGVRGSVTHCRAADGDSSHRDRRRRCCQPRPLRFHVFAPCLRGSTVDAVARDVEHSDWALLSLTEPDWAGRVGRSPPGLDRYGRWPQRPPPLLPISALNQTSLVGLHRSDMRSGRMPTCATRSCCPRRDGAGSRFAEPGWWVPVSHARDGRSGVVCAMTSEQPRQREADAATPGPDNQGTGSLAAIAHAVAPQSAVPSHSRARSTRQTPPSPDRRPRSTSRSVSSASGTNLARSSAAAECRPCTAHTTVSSIER